MRPTLRSFVILLLLAGVLQLHAQQITLLGLRSSGRAGAFHGLRQDSAGNLYTLYDAGDGVRLLKFNAAGTQLLGETVTGQNGDTGVALDLDPAGNIYVAGTTNSLGSVTGTAGTAFPDRAGVRTNSFVARFSPALQQQWLTFCGGEPLAVTSITATANSVLVTGSIFAATLPVTPNGIQQSPAPSSGSNGFVESFSSAGGSLQYATYLTGANGDTTPAAITSNSSGNAYITGATTASGFPTTAALVPTFRAANGGNVSGFVTELTPDGDGFVFSTFVPGTGLASAAFDASGTGSLLLSGNVAPGLFPLTQVQVPVASLLPYQTAIRLAADGSSVLSSTLLAPAAGSLITPGSNGGAWVFASLQNATGVPLLPVLPVESMGNAFALRVTRVGIVDRAARLGGLPVANSGFASLPVMEGGIALLPDGTVAANGSVAPTLSSDLLQTQFFDLPFAFAPNAALPSTVHDAVPVSDCDGSACSGSAGLLAKLAPDASAPTLALSTDDLPNLTLRNLGTTAANGVEVVASGYALNSGCAAALPAGGECSLSLSGSGPGSITVRASNAAAYTTQLPATSRAAKTIAVLPRELDFGIVTAASAAVTRTLTVTNLGTATQTFASQNQSTLQSTYTLTETGSTCTPSGSGGIKVLAPGGSCTVTLGLRAANGSTNDGPISARWQIGTSDVLLTGYLQSAAMSLSADTIDFGRQFAGGLRSNRYLYLSNSSDETIAHGSVTSTNPAFTATDQCAATLQPRSICRMVLGYQATSATSSDAMTLNVDGLQVTVLGETLPQPSASGTAGNPNLRVSPTSVAFTTPVGVTQVSSESHAVTIRNAGTLPFSLALATSGDFTYATGCPAILSGGVSCTVVLSFTPAAAGTRQGLLSVTADSSSPTYVALSGTGTAILPPDGSRLFFGDNPLNSPAVQWLKVSQSFASLSAASSDTNFRVLLVEDTGYGHGEPSAGAFSSTMSGACLNCYLGVQFLTLSTGVHTGTVLLTSPGGGQPATVAVSGNGIPLTGLILTPVSPDFGTLPVHSSSVSTDFLFTNGTASSITANSTTVTGDFSVTAESTGAPGCGSGNIAPGASCIVPVRFTPSLSGMRSGTLTVSTSAGEVTSTLTGTGSDDPGISFTPGELRFDNVPSPASRQQNVRITNTSDAAITVGSATVSDTHFAVSSACESLSPGVSCDLNVTYRAESFLSNGTLVLPITTAPAGAPSTTRYAVALSGLYTTDTAGLQIVPGEHVTVNFGAASTGLPALQRILHVNNLSTQPLAVTVESPRQFAILASTCSSLPANAACDLTVQYTPLTAGDSTGTVFLRGTPLDGSTTQTALGYLQGYGIPSNSSLGITEDISPSGVLDFGQIASGQTATRTLTITNPVGSPAGEALTVRRIRSEFPYRSASNCGAPLAPGQSCSVTITYSPLFQSAPGSGQTATQADTGVLTVESDSGTAPQFVDLAGSATPAFVVSPNNTAPIAAFTTSEGSLTFTSDAVGTASASQTVTLANTGTATLRIAGLITSNGFRASSPCVTLVAGASCDITVQYVPQNIAQALGALEIQSDSSASLEFVSLLGTVVTPQTPGPVQSIAVTPQSLNFSRVLVGRTASLLVTVSNTGSLPVILAERTVSGDASFSFGDGNGSNPCPPAGATLAAGASCTLGVSFTPAATGTLRGTLALASSATTEPLTVALSGTGTRPQLAVAPTAISFGDVALGSAATQALTLINGSTLPADGLRFSVTAGFAVSSTCGITTISPGSSCAVNVTYTPFSAGITTGLLTITSTDPASPLDVPLNGNAVLGNGTSTSTLTAAPASLDFGRVAVASSATLAFTLANATGVSADGLLFTATGGFTVSSACGTALNAYSTCPVLVTFSPAGAGTVTGTVTVQSSKSISPLTVALTGIGSNVQPQLTVTPGSLSFGGVAVGSSSTLPVTLRNTSTATVNSLVATASGGFITGGNCGSNLNPGSSCDVLITFSPLTAGAAAGMLTVRSTDAASPLTVALSASGTLLPPQLSLTPGSLNFGNVAIRSTGTLTTTLRNTSSTTVTRIVLGATPGFTTATECGTVLAPGSSCPITVSFTPDLAGVQTGTLTLNSSDSTSPLTASLVGAGTVPGPGSGSFTLLVNGAAAANTTVQAGLPANFALTVTPTGGYTGTVALTCAADTPVAYTACSLVPSSVVLAGAPQNSTATVTTVTAVDLSSVAAPQRRLQALLCLTPALLVLLLRRKRLAALLVLLISLLSIAGGCGSGGDPRIRYTVPGNYTFHVIATSTSGTNMSQAVTLKVAVTPR